MSETNSNMDSLVFVETSDNDVASIVKSLDNLEIFDQLSQLDTSWKVTYDVAYDADDENEKDAIIDIKGL
jgi:hypothetical protein